MTQLEPTIESQSIAGTVDPVGIIELLNAFAPSFFVAFIVTLLVTPLVRKLAIALGVIDQPGGRKSTPSQLLTLEGWLFLWASWRASFLRPSLKLHSINTDQSPFR